MREQQGFSGRHFNIIAGVAPQYFRPRGLKALTTGAADVPIADTEFTACAECGLLWNRIDPEKLRQVIRESGTESTRKKLGRDD